MLDWLSLKLPYVAIPDEILPVLHGYGDRIVRYHSKTGEIVWETPAWDSIRSDTHGLVVRMISSGFCIQGSPARCMGDGANVFGSSDPVACSRAMIRFATEVLSCQFPDYKHWICTRMDVTENYLLESLADVRSALAYLRNTEGGRYRVSQQAGDTVYWSHLSHLRSGKAYAKGPHIRHVRCNHPDGPESKYSDAILCRLDRLLRLELSLRSQFFRERSPIPWYSYTPSDLANIHTEYFGRMIGDITVPESDCDVLLKLSSVCPSDQVAKSVMRTFILVRHQGYELARESMSRATWYRHARFLRDAGLGDIDLCRGQVVPFRRRRIELNQPCTSFDMLLAA